MGNSQLIPKDNQINYEVMQDFVNKPSNILIINTLPLDNQHVTIKNTLLAREEETIINNVVKIPNKKLLVTIVLYGKNYSDETVIKKFHELKNLGFTQIYVYVGGLFEWLLLSDIYGDEEFPITSTDNLTPIDLLKFPELNKFEIKWQGIQEIYH